MPLWFCEFRTSLSGKVEAETQQEAVRKFREALDALDLGVGDIQNFRMDLSRTGYATEVESLEPKTKARRLPPWGNDPTT